MAVTNIPWGSITFSYTPTDGSAVQTITISAPEFGNQDYGNANQDYMRARGGQAYVYQHGTQVRSFTFHWPNLSATERIAIDDFFARNTLYSLRWFTVLWAPTEPEALRVGATVGGVPVIAGVGGYTSGQRIIMDTISFVVRLATPDIQWMEGGAGGEWDGYWDLTLSLEVLTTIPANV